MSVFAFIADLLGKILGPALDWLRDWQAQRTARRLGQAEQHAADSDAALTEARHAQDGRNAVGSGDADVDRMLRPPGERGR